MTNKEICEKYEEISDKAVKIAKTRGDYSWFQSEIQILPEGLQVIFYNSGYFTGGVLVAWEELEND